MKNNNKIQNLHPQSRVDRLCFTTLTQSMTVYIKLTKTANNNSNLLIPPLG